MRAKGSNFRSSSSKRRLNPARLLTYTKKRSKNRYHTSMDFFSSNSMSRSQAFASKPAPLFMISKLTPKPALRRSQPRRDIVTKFEPFQPFFRKKTKKSASVAKNLTQASVGKVKMSLKLNKSRGDFRIKKVKKKNKKKKVIKKKGLPIKVLKEREKSLSRIVHIPFGD